MTTVERRVRGSRMQDRQLDTQTDTNTHTDRQTHVDRHTDGRTPHLTAQCGEYVGSAHIIR